MSENKVALITGATRGIGREIALELAENGMDIAVNYRSEKDIPEDLKGEIEAYNVRCEFVQADVSDFEQCERMVKETIEKFGKIDVLVNNAGLSLHEGNIDNVSIEQFDAQIDTNLKASYFLSQKFLQHYFKTGKERGCILFITSERGDYVDDIPYGLTKASINSLVKGLAKLYIKKNIRINALGPGVTASAMTGREVGGDMYAPNYSTGRTYQPEEVAEVACFLISDAAACISGQIILCNNGNSINSYKKSL